MLITDLW